ncbi:MAG: hypothetical protein AB1486_30070 [Planctomycetota bacterium]
MNDLHYLPRLLGPVVERAIRAFPVVVHTGNGVYLLNPRVVAAPVRRLLS